MFDMKCNEPEVRTYKLRAVGGTTAISIDTVGAGGAGSAAGGGSGITITRTGTGAYLLTWSDNPGTFQGWNCGLGATTPGDIAGHTVIRGKYNATAFTLAFILYNASDAAHDLAALEHFDISVDFRDY